MRHQRSLNEAPTKSSTRNLPSSYTNIPALIAENSAKQKNGKSKKRDKKR